MTETDFQVVIQQQLRLRGRRRFGIIPDDEREEFLEKVMVEVCIAFRNARATDDTSAALRFAYPRLDEFCEHWVGEFEKRLSRYAMSVKKFEFIVDAIREEFIQDVFLAMQSKVDRGEPIEHPIAYGLEAFSNRCRDWIRRENRKEEAMEHLTASASPTNDTTVELLFFLEESANVLWTAIGRLKPKQRSSIVLRFWQGMSYLEAAEFLGITVNAFKSRLKAAKKKLRRLLENEMDTNDGSG